MEWVNVGIVLLVATVTLWFVWKSIQSGETHIGMGPGNGAPFWRVWAFERNAHPVRFHALVGFYSFAAVVMLGAAFWLAWRAWH